MANEERGEVEIQFNKDTLVTLRFRAAESATLGEMLGMSPISYLAKGGDQDNFIIKACMAGTSQIRKKDRVTPGMAAAWLDNADENFSRDDCQEKILYGWARGKGGAEATRHCKVLDEIYQPGDKDDDAKKKGGAASAAA